MNSQNLKVSVLHFSEASNLNQILQELPNIEVVYSGQFFKILNEGKFVHQTDVFLLSEKQFGMEVNEIMETIQSQNPNAKFVLVFDRLMNSLDEYIKWNLEYFVNESKLGIEIPVLFQKIINKEPFISGSLTYELLSIVKRKYANFEGGMYSLSDKGFKVLELLSEGKSYEQIGDEMEFSVNSVRFYIKQIYKSLNVNNRVQAVNIYRSSKFAVGNNPERRGRKAKIKVGLV